MQGASLAFGAAFAVDPIELQTTTVVVEYHLTITPARQAALTRMESSC